jgi:hypothetical protein
MLVVAGVAVLIRGAFVFRAPVLLTGDTESYLAPAYELARGMGFDLTLKRTPAYPAFLALVISGWSEDLRSLMLAQHLLGVLTAVLTFVLGRLTFGWLVGLVAGLLTAVNGALLIAEHTVMTEALFVPLVVGSLAALAGALHAHRWWPYLAAGALMGAATLTRPVAQILLPLAPIAILVAERNLRAKIRYSALALGAAVLVLAPWMIRSASEHDSPTVGSLGQTLVGRTARHDRGAFLYYDPAIHDSDPDGARLHARQVLQEAADRGSSGKAIHTRLRRELGLGAAETDRLMRDLALEAIMRQPAYYVQGTIQRFTRLSLGSVERFGAHRSAADVARERWEHDGTRHLLVGSTPAEERAEPIAARLVSIYQPGYAGFLVVVLAIAGLVLGMSLRFLSPSARGAIVATGLSTMALLGASAALVGNVSRYRFPVDPLLAVLAVGGAASIFWLARETARRRSDRGCVQPAEAPGVPSTAPDFTT